MSENRKRSLLFSLVLLFLLLGIARFVVSIVKDPQRWVSQTYIESVHETADSINPKRRWGPLSPAMMAVVESVPDAIPKGLLVRLILGVFYAWMLYMLVLWGREERRFTCRDALIVALGLQATSTIYSFTNGNAEIITAACIVGHSFFFVRRRYALAALVICLGVYYKLHPIVFAFPYFVFSALSAAHRRYCAYVIVFGLAVGLACVPIAGWENGLFYPLSMVRSVSSDAEIIPIVSKEVFAPIFFVTRALTSFQVRQPDAELISLTMRLTSVASFLFAALTVIAAVVLWRKERRWNTTQEPRNYALLVFDATIGFVFFACAVDFSLFHLMLISLALVAPLWLLLDEDCRLRLSRGTSALAGALYAAGSVAIGTVVPLSVLFRLLPLGVLDRLTGNAAASLIPHEKYVWYQIPMFGLLCIVAAFAVAALAARRRFIGAASPH